MARPDTEQPASYELTRFVFLRLLGLVYTLAFLSLHDQLLPLLGSHGLLPAARFLERAGAAWGGASWWRLPTLFWIDASDTSLAAAAWVGLALSLVLLAGYADVPILLGLWLIYSSFVNVGQTFYAYGWEILLLEATFLAIFLVPLVRPHPFPRGTPTSPIVIALVRWLLFRVMFGAGLIKLRGDPCWRELTCLAYHYETQPIPNPLSLYLHHSPLWFHRVEVLFNHFVELVVPWGVFGPRPVRHVAGAFLVAFQAVLILSGNLSFLNWLTLALCLCCFDDSFYRRWLPDHLVGAAARAAEARETEARRLAVVLLAVVVAALSASPVVNMLSSRQVMNRSFEPLHLVNTYGAFGTIGRARYEIVLQGTDDPKPGPDAHWLDYQFECQPVDVQRRPCVISPYHYRLDWQLWFAAMSSIDREPWLVHLVYQLLHGDPGALSLLAPGPFETAPPRFVRARLYRYTFAEPEEEVWWHRAFVREYMRPVSADDPAVRRYLERADLLP